jgi:hypothetical protein
MNYCQNAGVAMVLRFRARDPNIVGLIHLACDFWTSLILRLPHPLNQ